MPIYRYTCDECDLNFRVFQPRPLPASASASTSTSNPDPDPAPTATADGTVNCPRCGRPASRQTVNRVGVHFKGKGFHATDYRRDGKGPKESDAASASKSDGDKS